MNSIDALGINSNLGLAANNMGIRPDALTNPSNNFLRLLNEAESREKKQSLSDNEVQVNTIPRKPTIDKTDKLYEQCLELESFLVKNILNSMRKNVIKTNLIDTGYAGEIYEDMLWDEYAKEYTKNAGFGLADLAYLELTGQRGRKVSN